MRSRPFATVVTTALTAATLTLALVGCSASGSVEVGPTVSGPKLAATAAKALAEKVGSTPTIDCGRDAIIIVKGKKVTCELTDADGLIYDTVVTFTSVAGSKYHIDVKVADTAKNAPTPTIAPGTSPTVKGTDIAQLAAGALAPSLGFTPDIRCADATVPIAVGNTEACTFSYTGADHDVTVTITSFDGSHYEIDAKVTD